MAIINLHKIVSPYTDRDLELLYCPCGGEPQMKWVGTEHSRIRRIRIVCGDCRLLRNDAVVKYGFSWLEDIAVKNWNSAFAEAWEAIRVLEEQRTACIANPNTDAWDLV